MIKYKEEVLRKLVHLSSLWIPLLYLYTNLEVLMIFLVPLVIMALVVDFGRKYIHSINKFVNIIIGPLMRNNEKDASSFSGATFLLIGAIFTVILFKREIAIYSLTVLVISDTMAALVGRKFGKIKIFEKSLEGSLSFFISAVLTYLFFQQFFGFSIALDKVIFASLIGTITELFSKKLFLDDNLTIPIVMSLVISL